MSEPYQLRYWGPDLNGRPDRGVAGCGDLGTALSNARVVVHAREHSAPASHVRVVNRETEEVLFAWDGPEIRP